MRADVLSAAMSAKPAQSADKLDRVRSAAKAARDLELEIGDMEEALSVKKQKLTEILTRELPDLFKEVKIRELTLEGVGNEPAYEVNLVPFYSASVPKDPDLAAKALDHIAKVWKMPDLIKNDFSVKFGKGDAKSARRLASLLKKEKFDYSNRVSVHSSTLTAEVRRRFESGSPLSPKELQIIGGYAGEVIKLKRKEDK